MSRFTRFPPLGLAYVAAVTPSNWSVKILDENITPFQYEEADFVGITAFTSNINRAYEIAQLYKKKNTKVAIGGIHASMSPNEALRFVDVVVIGEAEKIWPEVIKDFEDNKLNSIYVGPRIDFRQTDIKPRRDLLSSDYMWNSLQTSRGCPFDCEFCTVSTYLGRKYRQREAYNIISELEEIEGKYIAFVDDNMFGYNRSNKERTKQLFRAMIERDLQKLWWMQSSINAASDESAVELAAQAGCMFVFIGFETIDTDSLKHMGKGVNLETGIDNYKKVVDVFHKYGIAVLGAFIIGNDNESPQYYSRLADFLVQSGIDIIQITLLTPLPGTKLMDRLLEQDRIIHTNYPEDWKKYRFSHMIHRPVGITSELIYTGDNFIKNRIYSFPTYPLRLLKSLRTLSKQSFHATVKFNQALKKGWKNSYYYSRYPKKLPVNRPN